MTPSFLGEPLEYWIELKEQALIVSDNEQLIRKLSMLRSRIAGLEFKHKEILSILEVTK